MIQTISIDINSQILAKAQNYSRKMGSDISHFIEMLLYQFVSDADRVEPAARTIKPIEQLSPFVQNLCGVITNTPELDRDIDGDEARFPPFP